MGPSPTYHLPKRDKCETWVEHGLPLWAESAAGYCSRRPSPSPMRGSRFVGARAAGPWVGEQKPLGKTPLGGNPSPEMTYLPTFTRVVPCNKKITGEQTVKMLVEQWFEPYGAPKQVHSDDDVRIRSDTGWYKRVLNAPNAEVTTGVPCTHMSDPLCERQNRVVEKNARILMKQEHTKDWVRLVPWAALTMNSQRSSSTGFTLHELFHGGRPAWFFKTPFPDDFKSPVGDWLEHKQSMANQAGTNLGHMCEREMSRRNRLLRPASFKVGDRVLVHHSRLPSWPRNCLQDPYLGPYRVIRIYGSRIHVRCSPRLGGELLSAPKQLRHYHSPDDLSWDEWRLSDSEIERIDLENAASPEIADQLGEMTADEMAVDGYYVVAGIARHEYKQGWEFLTLWDGYGLCPPVYSQMGVSSPSFAPTSLRTTRDSY